MKRILLFTLSIFTSVAIYAQVSLYNDNSESIEGDTITFYHAIDTVHPYPEFEHKNFVNVVNETNDTIIIRVKREEILIIQGTKDYFCWGECYGAVAAGEKPVWESPDVVDFAPGDTGTGDNDLSVYIEPHNKTGEALYRYTFIDTSDMLGINDQSIYVKYILSYLTSTKEKQANEVSFNLYPNPASNQVMLDFDKGLNQNLSVEVKDILGKQIETVAVNSSAKKLQLDLSSYSKGIYFISVLDNQQIVKTKKLIVK
ncbi:MAG: T9SS type A sorting domain-containing protein [Vicingaceae bacterium]